MQQANFSAVDHASVTAGEATRIFEQHDWRAELEFYAELQRAGAECCPPGLGFVAPDGRVLHICPGEAGSAMVHYHCTLPRKVLGFISIPRSAVETVEDVPRSVVLDLIGLFFAGHHDAMMQNLRDTQRGSRPRNG